MDENAQLAAIRSKADEKNALQDELILNEIDSLCNKTLESYIEP